METNWIEVNNILTGYSNGSLSLNAVSYKDYNGTRGGDISLYNIVFHLTVF